MSTPPIGSSPAQYHVQPEENTNAAGSSSTTGTPQTTHENHQFGPLGSRSSHASVALPQSGAQASQRRQVAALPSGSAPRTEGASSAPLMVTGMSSSSHPAAAASASMSLATATQSANMSTQAIVGAYAANARKAGKASTSVRNYQKSLNSLAAWMQKKEKGSLNKSNVSNLSKLDFEKFKNDTDTSNGVKSNISAAAKSFILYSEY
jgi:hypothetical protein